MSTSDKFPSSIRLLVAGVGSMLLLIWALFGGLPPLIVPPGTSVSSWPIMITAGLAVMILVTLVPILFRGSAAERWLSLALGAFPFLVLAVIVLWTAGVSHRDGF